LILSGLCGTFVATAATDTRLADAVRAGDSVTALALIARHADANAMQPDGSTALLWAAHNDDLKMSEALLKGGASVKIANRYGISPLTEAAVNGNSAMVRMFLDAGADPNTALPEGDTVLMLASRAGSLDAVKSLVEHGANVNAKESFHDETALMWAAGENQPEIIRYLAAHGAQIDLHAKEMKYPETKDMKQKASATPVSTYPKGGLTALMEAARQNSFEAAQALLEAGANPNEKSPDRMSTLVIAVANAHWDLANLLIEHGADVNDGSLAVAVTMKSAPLMRAASYHPDKMTSVDFIKASLARGAKPDQTLNDPLPAKGSQFVNGLYAAPDDSTALYRAAKAADYSLMKILIDAGANAKIVIKDGSSPLMISMGVGGRRGGNNQGDGNYGAVELQEDAMMKAATLCLEQGADINVADASGETALHGVAGRGSDRLVQFLVDHGAKTDLKDKQGRTPLDVANGKGGGRGGTDAPPQVHPTTVALLRKLMGLPAQEAESASAKAPADKAQANIAKPASE
jgi:ankyrin repeat protein